MEPPPRSKSPVVPGNLFQGMSANTDWNSNNLLAPVDAMLSNSLSLADFEDATLTSANTADQQLVDSLALEMAKITLPIEWHGPAYLLIQKLLDLASPRLDDRMVESLEMDGFLDIFLSFLTRVHSEASPVVGYPPRSDFMDPDELRRSYNVMEILSSPSSASTRLVSEKTPEILNHLLVCFAPSSHASFHHFKQVFDVLLSRSAPLVMETMFNPPPANYVKLVPASQGRPFLLEMLNYVHEAPVCHCLLASLMFPATRVGHLTKVERFEKVRSIEFMEVAISSFVKALHYLRDVQRASGDRVKAEACVVGWVDFLTRLVEESAKTDDSGVLFSNLQDNPALLDPLVDIVRSKEFASNQRRMATEVLHAFLLKSITKPPRPFFADANTRVDDNLPLRSLQQTISKHMRTRMSDICYAVELGQASPLAARGATMVSVPEVSASQERFEVSPKRPTDSIVFSSYQVGRPFTASRLQLLEILYELVRPRAAFSSAATEKTQDGHPASPLMAAKYTQADYDKLAALYQLVPWRILVNWFFEYPQNNAFHALFYKLVDVVLKTKIPATLKTVLGKSGLVGRLIEAYGDVKRVEQRGFIILLLNAIRLAADKDDQDATSLHYVRSVLTGAPGWEEFEKELRSVTEGQILSICGKSLVKSGLDKPMPCVTPLPPPLVDRGALEDKTLELGSEYAACLGYFEPKREEKPITPTKPKLVFGSKTAPVLGKGISIRERLAMRIAAQQASESEPPLADSVRVARDADASSPSNEDAKKKKRRKRKSVSDASSTDSADAATDSADASTDSAETETQDVAE